MNCPYRINQKVTKRYQNYHGNGEYLDIENYYPKCEKTNCPWFYIDDTDYKEICLQVKAELRKAGF